MRRALARVDRILSICVTVAGAAVQAEVAGIHALAGLHMSIAVLSTSLFGCRGFRCLRGCCHGGEVEGRRENGFCCCFTSLCLSSKSAGTRVLKTSSRVSARRASSSLSTHLWQAQLLTALSRARSSKWTRWSTLFELPGCLFLFGCTCCTFVGFLFDAFCYRYLVLILDTFRLPHGDIAFGCKLQLVSRYLTTNHQVRFNQLAFELLRIFCAAQSSSRLVWVVKVPGIHLRLCSMWFDWNSRVFTISRK